jgi:putative sugar O-methyltransferase
MALLKSWIGKAALSRRAKKFFPESPLPDREAARARFGDALKTARAAYECMRDNTAHSDFVHPDWSRNIREVETYFLKHFDLSFLDNPVINGSMVFTNRQAHAVQWAWLERWRDTEALKKYIGGGASAHLSGTRQKLSTAINSVHHLYHLSRYEHSTGRRIEKVRRVVEFGGGYGNLARVFRNFGQISRYAILDLPLFSCIQYVYLSTAFGPDRVRLENGTGEGTGEETISMLPLPFLDRAVVEGDLFVSTWALSESTRQAYSYVKSRHWFGAESILLAYNEKWKPWDDAELGEDLEGLGHKFAVEPISFLPGNHYVFSLKRIS